MITISSTKPIVVAQYIKSYEPLISCSDSGVLPEPSNIIVPAVQAYTGNVTFPVLLFTIGGLQYYYINVITKCEYKDGFIFDNWESMDTWEVLKTDDNKMCAIRGPVDVGTHSVGHINPEAKFTVTVYMVCTCLTSYAYQAITAPFAGKYKVGFTFPRI